MANWELACKELGLLGKWKVDETREQPQDADPPLYDISWVLDKPIPVIRQASASGKSEKTPLMEKK